jgi:hypothetical protein
LNKLSINGSAIVFVLLGVAAPPDSSVPPPTATPECEEAVAAILDDWQDIIDGWADEPLEEFVAGERIYNVTDVPIGGAGCEPLTATTIAMDRAGELEAETATAAVVRGLILADVGEMALYGPGLDLEVPTTPAEPDVTADLDSLVELEPSAGSSCAEWQDYALIVLQESVDVAALADLGEMFGGDKDYDDSQIVLNDALMNAFDGAARADCDNAEFLLGMLEGWPELQATNLTANLAIGGHTDFVYGELFDV